MIIAYYMAHTSHAVCFGPFKNMAYAYQWVIDHGGPSIPRDVWKYTTVMSPES